MAMTIAQIRKYTPFNRRVSSKIVKIVEIKVKKNIDGYPLILAKTISTETPKGEAKNLKTAPHYVTSIELYPKKQVIVSCSCDDWLFTYEVACNKKGAARIEYSNGENPGTRNPAMTPGCCKHLYALSTKLISEGKL
jgi:hypothetical protein